MAANAHVSVIGRTTRVRGRVTGAADLEVQGFVDGEIAVAGDVTVDAHGMVGAGIQGRRLVVRGAVRGDLLGEESVLLEDGARVVGDVRAPRVAIAPGALVRGFVETGEGERAAASRARAATGAAAGRAPAPAAPARAPAAAPASAAASAPAPPSKPATRAAPAIAVAGGAGGTNHAPQRRPPPPVVPVLKKAKGQLARKRER
jgi:cytoskeletal protein CcmA (bactofilin family)